MGWQERGVLLLPAGVFGYGDSHSAWAWAGGEEQGFGCFRHITDNRTVRVSDEQERSGSGDGAVASGAPGRCCVGCALAGAGMARVVVLSVTPDGSAALLTLPSAAAGESRCRCARGPSLASPSRALSCLNRRTRCLGLEVAGRGRYLVGRAP